MEHHTQDMSAMPLNADDTEALRLGRHADPFSVLGPHSGRVRAWFPGAAYAWTVQGENIQAMVRNHADGVFEGTLAQPGTYRLRACWADGSAIDIEDPYRFGPVLSATDVWLLAEGTHLRPFEVLGAHEHQQLGVTGVAFTVWAPNASRVSVVGDFNAWDGRRHPMRLRRECGVWELFLPDLPLRSRYKFELLDGQGQLLPQRADPYARQAELRPGTASLVAPMPPKRAADPARQRANALDAPMSIYEVHLPSWRQKVGAANASNQGLSWDELATTLLPYARDMGFTHLELMPITEYPFDGSWGYQTLGLFAASARFGDGEGLARFMTSAHAAGLGVLLDWVPAHFPNDAFGLASFDGSHLYEYADPKEGLHKDWNTHIYNWGRTEVRNFLVGSALYWLERFGVDGLRVDAVASMLYRDYSRPAGEWVPNAQGGRENLEAIAFIRRLNEVVGSQTPNAVTLAEESTAFPAVSRPTDAGGLGFHYKWNMGWMHDTLQYMARDPIHRPFHHGEMSFGLVYAFNENFLLPLSHDEVVHGKGSMVAKMAGNRWQRFANLRAYYGFMWGHPGKKLLFMGCEFAQEREWNHDVSLDWHLLESPAREQQPEHAGVQSLVRDLNALYKSSPALYQTDFSAEGFEWIDHQDAQRSLFSFVRRGRSGELMLVVSNFAPVVHHGLRLGVPAAGRWVERLNTDSHYYGGSNVGTPLGQAQSEALVSHGRAQSIVITVPPLATVFLQWTA